MSARPTWQPTGWVASSDGGRVIEWTLTLPCGMCLRVKRRDGVIAGYRWVILPGGHDEAGHATFADAPTAKREAMRYARAEMRRALRMLGAR